MHHLDLSQLDEYEKYLMLTKSRGGKNENIVLRKIRGAKIIYGQRKGWGIRVASYDAMKCTPRVEFVLTIVGIAYMSTHAM